VSDDRNLEAIRRAWEAREAEGFEAGAALLVEVLHPEVEFSPWLGREVEQRVCRGPAEVRAFFEDLDDTLSEIRYEDRRYEQPGDDVVIVLTRLTGVPRGGATRVENDLGLVFEFEEGLVRRFTAYGSHDEAIEAARELVHAQA
jgi:ketosteroid isomerase-like protein